MHHALLVHVRNRAGHLEKVVPDLPFFKGSCGFAQQAAQVAIFCPLEDDHQLVVLDEGVQVGDEILMLADGLQHEDLAQALIARLGIHHVKDVDLLERHVPPVHHACAVHHRKLAGPNLLAHLIHLQPSSVYRQDLLKVTVVAGRLASSIDAPLLVLSSILFVRFVGCVGRWQWQRNVCIHCAQTPSLKPA
jgi:hypothetical protein